MVTVTQRPEGVKLIDQAISAILYNHFGDALINFNAHSLVTGEYVIIESDIDDYNGLWYVDVLNVDTFRIRENAGSSYFGYLQDADIQYYQTQPHQWSCVFLPIVYKATNDRWPQNNVNAGVAVSSQSNDNGYTLLNISGPTGAEALEYVKLSDGNVYQVIENGSGTTTVNLAYDASNNFTTAQKYYNSYQVKVKIYAGLESGQYWENKKPFREVATLSLTPDANNNVMFSVAEYIKALLIIRNNPTLYSMPLNLDAFAAFYIETAESFDGSDGYTITTNESSYAVDDFIGYALAGKLPFKNLYSGFLSDYITTSGYPASWLNTLTTVMGVVDQYFDISFIKNLPGEFQIIIDKYANNYLYETETIDYEDFGIGVYRIPLTFTSAFDQFCVRAYRPGTPGVDPPTPPTLPVLSSWTNLTFGWTTGATPTISVNGNGGVSNWLIASFASIPGEDHDFSSEIEIGVTGISTPTSVVTIAFLNGAGAVLDSEVFNYATAGVKPESVTLNSPTASTYVGIFITNNTPFDTKNYYVNAFTFDGLADGGTGIPAIPDQNLTEEICIDIYEVCGFDDAATVEPTRARRLLEDGGFRLLED